uniref:Peptide methionine sulfoxide reductase n=1 Tax=Cacopsylla melanoneura TaxID=428564 RepID=A0A8D8T7A1_9HEMI
MVHNSSSNFSQLTVHFFVSLPLHSYHQKYRLRQHTYLHSKLNFKTEECYKTSHVASRLNGYVVGFGGVKQFEEEADKLGLSDDVKTYVRKYVVQYERSGMMC